MRAAVLLAERSVGMEEVPDARLPGPDGVVVTIEQAAICGSDLHLYHGDLGLERVQLGHEAVGLVAEVGADVHTLSVGDRVLISGVIACGHCTSCWRGDPVGCRNGQTAVLGTTPELPGGQAEAIGVPGADAFVTKVPDGIGVEDSVLLTDILPTGYLGALRADITPGDTVVVVGLGPVGIMALECAGLFGPAHILAVDVVPTAARVLLDSAPNRSTHATEGRWPPSPRPRRDAVPKPSSRLSASTRPSSTPSR